MQSPDMSTNGHYSKTKASSRQQQQQMAYQQTTLTINVCSASSQTSHMANSKIKMCERDKYENLSAQSDENRKAATAIKMCVPTYTYNAYLQQ